MYSGYALICHALRYQAETWHGVERQAREVFEGIFSKRPHLRSLRGLKVVSGLSRDNQRSNC